MGCIICRENLKYIYINNEDGMDIMVRLYNSDERLLDSYIVDKFNTLPIIIIPKTCSCIEIHDLDDNIIKKIHYPFNSNHIY